MLRKYKILLGLLVLGVIIAVLTAQPEADVIADERTADMRSDIFFTYTTVRYPARVNVTAYSDTSNFTLGVSVDTDLLDFGQIMAGGSVKKQINLTTRDEKTSRILVKARGSIAPFISFDRTDFLLKRADVVHVTASIPETISGFYDGEVVVVVQRSNNDLIRSVIGY